MNPIIKQALETSYNRAIDDRAVYSSTLSALTGYQAKYKRVADGRGGQRVERTLDLNIYNWIEQVLFFPLRLLKNTAKLLTEFVWNLGYEGFGPLSGYLKARAAVQEQRQDPSEVKIFALRGLGYFFQGLSYLSWFIGKVGQSITSPFAALKQTFAYAEQKTGSRTWAYLAANLHGFFILSAYGALAAFAAPLFAPSLVATVAVNVLSGYGLALLAGLKVVLRYFSPSFKSSGSAAPAAPTTSTASALRATQATSAHNLSHSRLLAVPRPLLPPAQIGEERKNEAETNLSLIDTQMADLLNNRNMLQQALGESSKQMNYLGRSITNESTYLHPDDLFLLTLAFKKELGIVRFNPLVEGMDNKTLYTATSMASAYQPMTPLELQVLTEKNKNFKGILAAMLNSDKPKVSALISSMGMDGQQNSHFINLNLERKANQLSITIDDSFTPLLSPAEKANYTQRLQSIFTALLNPLRVALSVNPVALQQSANCGIHALINKINHEHNLNLNPETLAAPLRKAIDCVYDKRSSADLSEVIRKAVHAQLNTHTASRVPANLSCRR